MKNFYNQKESNVEFQKKLLKRLLEAELKLLEKEKEYILKEAITADDRVNANIQLLKLDLEMQKKKESYARNIINIYIQEDDLYNSKNIYNDYL